MRDSIVRNINNIQLEHPNIIEIYEVYDNPGFFYIVMEYC